MLLENNVIASSAPSLRETFSKSAVNRTYHWETPDKKHIFLHFTFTPKQRADGSHFLLVTVNFDSSDVKGQGKHLLKFCEDELDKVAQQGLGHNFPLIPVLHQVSPNQYSEPLFKNNPDYSLGADGNYYRIHSLDITPPPDKNVPTDEILLQ